MDVFRFEDQVFWQRAVSVLLKRGGDQTISLELRDGSWWSVCVRSRYATV
jgi:hypothetical protein